VRGKADAANATKDRSYPLDDRVGPEAWPPTSGPAAALPTSCRPSSARPSSRVTSPLRPSLDEHLMPHHMHLIHPEHPFNGPTSSIQQVTIDPLRWPTF